MELDKIKLKNYIFVSLFHLDIYFTSFNFKSTKAVCVPITLQKCHLDLEHIIHTIRYNTYYRQIN